MAPPAGAPRAKTLRLPLRPALARAALALALLQESPARAEPAGDAPAGALATDRPAKDDAAKTEPPPSAEKICRTLTQAAADNGLPIQLFTRLIWQESRFNSSAVSPKGAMGIAQFMPRTAASRGLADPFEPLTALRESAAYLAELRVTFKGNLGLAVAGYNAGPGRVEGWLAGGRTLPEETRAYVRIVTGHAVEAWTSEPPPEWKVSDSPSAADCTSLARLVTASLKTRPVLPKASPAWGPWGVQLAAKWHQGRALATYEQLRRTYGSVLRDRLPLVVRTRLPGRRGATKYNVRVSEKSRVNADALCAKLRNVGGACIVLRNPG
ncbi:MAG: transglycosylase SLT domain-containing protein [Hyphomicrobiaceae bacterium]